MKKSLIHQTGAATRCLHVVKLVQIISVKLKIIIRWNRSVENASNGRVEPNGEPVQRLSKRKKSVAKECGFFTTG